jgi:hypothetical protein
MPIFFMREISVVRLISMRDAGTVGACYSPVCDSQDADDLIAFICFARARHRNVPAVVAQFIDRSMQRRPMRKDHRTLDEIVSSRIFPGQCQPESFFIAAAGIDSICFCMSAAVLLCEVSDQQRNVLRAFACLGRRQSGRRWRRTSDCHADVGFLRATSAPTGQMISRRFRRSDLPGAVCPHSVH